MIHHTIFCQSQLLTIARWCGERVDANEYDIHSTKTNQLCEKKGGNSQATMEWTITVVQGFIAVEFQGTP